MDFALSMVASAEMSHLSGLLDRVDKLKNDPQLNNYRFTLEEFKSFAALRKKLQPFSLALFSYGKVNGLLTREDFQRAASQVGFLNLRSFYRLNIYIWITFMFSQSFCILWRVRSLNQHQKPEE